MSETEKNCTGCKFGCHLDFGYSNYTTEGTTFVCAKQLHPDGSFDEFYGKDKRLKYAEKCAGFEPGKGVSMDVDCEKESSLTPEQKEIYELGRAAQGNKLHAAQGNKLHVEETP